MIDPKAAKLIVNETVQDLLRALLAAYSALHGSGVVATKEISPTDFDCESIWWIEPGMPNQPYSQADYDYYYRLTNLPPDKAMLSLSIDGDEVTLCFMPKTGLATKSTPKPKGFGK